MARGEQIQQERRRRNSNGLSGKRNRLAVDESMLDRENFVYRFVNDEPGRIHALTVQDDWEPVVDRKGEIKTDGTGMGSEVAVHVGQGSQGQTRAVLLRKRKDWYEDDKRQEQRVIDDLENSLKAGNAPGAESDGTYTPKGGIVFENGAKV